MTPLNRSTTTALPLADDLPPSYSTVLRRFHFLFTGLLLTACYFFPPFGGIKEGLSQPSGYRLSRKEYIEKFRDYAVREMLLNDIPASITMAQALLESDNGNSPLAVYANNHFGIKCHAEWYGLRYIKDDDASNECFRKYHSPVESYDDHSFFLKNRYRYRQLFDLGKYDYKGWAAGLKEAGYATNPKYAELLIIIIEEYKLYELDQVTSMPKITPVTASAAKPRFGKREIALNNGVKYIIARDGDSYFKIATETEMMLWEIFKYNDLLRTDKVKSGQVIYLQPKRRKSFTVDFHTVKPGETMHDISQKYGVKLNFLYKLNSIPEGTQVEPGQKVLLRKKVKGKTGGR
ncbi:MAG: glucosaminidase domain-containing protein [Bacteroidetes bacterium]|nr:glucosaminidase domain-containing protein [Bacteroidota bacterium]